MSSGNKSRVLPMRFSPTAIALIDKAAAQIGETRAEFIRNSAQQRAAAILQAPELRVQPAAEEVA